MSTFNFDIFLQNNDIYKNSIDYFKQLSWFIGFSEGFDSWQVDIVSNRNYFIITQKDSKVLYKIRNILGFGKVKKYGDCFRFIVADQKGTLKIIQICNGNLLLEKCKNRFSIYLQVFNNFSKLNLVTHDRASIDLIYNELKPSLNDSWLAGFIDANGCFSFDKGLGDNVSALIFHITQCNDLIIFNI